MSKKTFLIISVTLVTLLIVLIGYYLLIQNNTGDTGKPSIFRSFFPFGGDNNATSTVRTPEEELPLPNDDLNYTQKLRKLSTEPVSGAGILDVKAGSLVRYIEKATGHIYEVELFSPIQNRISNTTIPLVYDAVWGNKNTSLVTRYLSEDNTTIDTYSLILKDVSTSTENSLSGIPFPRNIIDVSVFGASIFYLEQKENSSSGYISNFGGSIRKQIWNSEIKELLSQYVNSKIVALTTKPAKNVLGYLYFVDTGSGVVKKILGGIIGLSTLTSPDATQVLYLAQGDAVSMAVFEQKTNITISITPNTFPEKCVWSKKEKSVVYCAVPQQFLNGDSLTQWYKGIISFTDDIWKYDLKNNTAVIVASLYEESSEFIDAIKPILSENEQYLIFVNKIDDSLWSLDLLK